LAALDDHMLADLGLSRTDLNDALSEPLWRDPTALLARPARRAPPVAPGGPSGPCGHCGDDPTTRRAVDRTGRRGLFVSAG